MHQRDHESSDDRQCQDLVRNGDVGEGHDRHPDQIEDRDQNTETFGPEPVQPAERKFAPLIGREPARAGQETPPVLLDDLEAAISPAMALLLERLIGVGQQAMAVAVVGVMRQPAVLDDREAQIGVLADGVAGPAAGHVHRRAADQAHGAVDDDGVGLVALDHADIEEAGIFAVHDVVHQRAVAVAMILRRLHEADARIGESGYEVLQPVRLHHIVGVDHADDLGIGRGALHGDAQSTGLEALHLLGVDELEALTEGAAMILDRLPEFRIGRVVDDHHAFEIRIVEPPDMLKQTLDAVARLDYPNFECVVIINNTPDPEFWQPIQDHCRTLGERFKFINAEKVKGFKAGALRIAMDRTAADAEIIGIIDADYVVHPDWLKDLVLVFADPRVGLVQAPQEHRDGDRSLMHYIMNGEYAGFFDIGMVQRNEYNAIIVHGTMCLIRRAAMDMAGGWAGDTICEDTDLGLAIIEHGWLTHYTNQRYGHGLLPDTYEAFKKQRHRWAYGGFQIVKKHWRRFLPGASRLSPDQRREFTLGWLNWLGAES